MNRSIHIGYHPTVYIHVRSHRPRPNHLCKPWEFLCKRELSSVFALCYRKLTSQQRSNTQITSYLYKVAPDGSSKAESNRWLFTIWTSPKSKFIAITPSVEHITSCYCECAIHPCFNLYNENLKKYWQWHKFCFTDFVDYFFRMFLWNTEKQFHKRFITFKGILLAKTLNICKE